MTNDCSCCKGIEVLTPKTLANRPGLNALVTRVGTHATFLETMKARLSSSDYPILRQLTTRSENDFSIALFDAWATVADVLSFYQERIANEAYLRTATERRSILELARLVGYTLRPGVASSVYLAFTLENGYDVEITAGTPAQSVPSPGKLLQTFETAEKLESRAAWNSLKPRLTRPHRVEKELNIEATDKRKLTNSNTASNSDTNTLYFKGISTRLTPNEPLLIDLGDEKPLLYRVMEVKPDSVASRTAVTLKPWQSEIIQRTPTDSPTVTSKEDIVNRFLEPLSPATIPPRSSADLARNLETTFGENSATNTELLTNLHPRLKPVLYQALEKAIVTKPTSVKIYALRVQASVFGHNAPPIPSLDNGNIIGYEEWPLTEFSRDTEPFEIALKLEKVYQTGSFVTMGTIQIKIDNQSTPIDKRLLQSETFSIDFPAAKETIQVTVEVQNNQIASFKLKFDFQKRKNQVEISFDDQEKLQVTSSGSNPTTVTRAIAQQVISGPNVDQPVSGVIGSSAVSPDGIGADLLGTEEIERKLVQTATSTYYSGGLEIKVSGNLTKRSGPVNTTKPPTEQPKFVSLDAPYGQILPGSWVVVDKLIGNNQKEVIVSKAVQVSTVTRKDYGLTGKSSQIELDQEWVDPKKDSFDVIRGTSIYGQSESLELAEAPIDSVSEAICGSRIELEGLVNGMKSGRWLIVSGERTDIPGVKGIKNSELVMLSRIEESFDSELSGDKNHSTLVLANELAYCYDPHTVTIYGNVIKATHGETHIEVLGSGDASKEMQQFPLRQSPLTYVAATPPSFPPKRGEEIKLKFSNLGVASTLQVRINDILWHETDSLVGAGKNDRNFITKTDNESQTTVIFGNGKNGARIPTGIENVKAVYRTGIGKPGNLPAEQISLLAKRPLGVKGVTNPLPATGGSDPESRDQARRRVPLGVMALDRLVSVQDYEDFARTFAGIDKASAVTLSDSRKQLVHLTIAGADDIPIEPSSDLYLNLIQTLHQVGDPYQQVKVDVRSLILLVISAKVRILPDYLWEAVERQIRTALLDTFSFERRELGQDVLLSEVISTIQQVPGVDYVDVDSFGGIPEKVPGTLKPPTSQEIADQVKQMKVLHPRLKVDFAESKEGVVYPAQLAFLSPEIKDTLILTELIS